MPPLTGSIEIERGGEKNITINHGCGGGDCGSGSNSNSNSDGDGGGDGGGGGKGKGIGDDNGGGRDGLSGGARMKVRASKLQRRWRRRGRKRQLRWMC